jgi:Fe-S cluster assembly iron-binding protein IscA
VMSRRIQRQSATITLKKKISPRVRKALRNGRKVRLRLTVHATSCAGVQRVLRPRVRLRR